MTWFKINTTQINSQARACDPSDTWTLKGATSLSEGRREVQRAGAEGRDDVCEGRTPDVYTRGGT